MSKIHYCKVPECPNRAHGLGLCRYHYKIHKKGKDINVKVPLVIDTPCQVNGCHRPSVNKQVKYCMTHYKRFLNGQVIDAPIQEHRENCSIEGCESKHFAKGFCNLHFWKKKREENLLMIIELKGNKCNICKNTYHSSCYDFHHRDPGLKDYGIATILTDNREKILKEVEKCDLLCANCHRKLHYDLGHNEKRVKISSKTRSTLAYNARKRKNQFSDEQIMNMIDLRREGQTLEEIAKIYGTSFKNVSWLTRSRLKLLNQTL